MLLHVVTYPYHHGYEPSEYRCNCVRSVSANSTFSRPRDDQRPTNVHVDDLPASHLNSTTFAEDWPFRYNPLHKSERHTLAYTSFVLKGLYFLVRSPWPTGRDARDQGFTVGGFQWRGDFDRNFTLSTPEIHPKVQAQSPSAEGETAQDDPCRR